MDWALLEICGPICVLDNEWRSSAHIPCITLSTASVLRQDHPIVREPCKKPPRIHLDTESSPRTGLLVSKSGATSSKTNGKVFRGSINLSVLKRGYHSDYHEEISGWFPHAELRRSNYFLKAWKIVCEDNSDGSREAFSVPGDSGSWVWNKDSELVGMLFGGHHDPCTMMSTTLFTPFKSILDCLGT